MRSFSAILIAAVVLTTVANGQSAPVLEAHLDGDVFDTDIRIDQTNWLANSGLVWEDLLSFSGSNYLRVRLRREGAPFPQGARLLMVGELGDRVTVELDQLGEDGVWSSLVPFARARVVLISETPIQIDSVLVLDQIALQTNSTTLYSVVGPSNDILPINDLAVPNKLTVLGSSVAFLSFIQGGFARTCTGFLIGDDILMTNEHCINDAETCSSMSAVFGYEYNRQQQLGYGPQVRCASVETLRLNYELDVSIVTLTQNPGAGFDRVDLLMQPAEAGTPLVIVQHPGSQPKQISFLDCVVSETPVDGRATDTDFAHSCDTASGSSGAPVFTHDGQLVGVHHFGFADGDGWDNNRAVHGSLVADWSAETHETSIAD